MTYIYYGLYPQLNHVFLVRIYRCTIRLLERDAAPMKERGLEERTIVRGDVQSFSRIKRGKS